MPQQNVQNGNYPNLHPSPGDPGAGGRAAATGFIRPPQNPTFPVRPGFMRPPTNPQIHQNVPANPNFINSQAGVPTRPRPFVTSGSSSTTSGPSPSFRPAGLRPPQGGPSFRPSSGYQPSANTVNGSQPYQHQTLSQPPNQIGDQKTFNESQIISPRQVRIHQIRS